MGGSSQRDGSGGRAHQLKRQGAPADLKRVFAGTQARDLDEEGTSPLLPGLLDGLCGRGRALWARWCGGAWSAPRKRGA